MKKIIWFMVATLSGIGIAILLRTTIFTPYVIPSGSMEPTLPVGSYVIVNKTPWAEKSYQTGDVIVFEDDNDWLNPEEKKLSSTMVKRVIATPGDTVTWDRDLGLLINNQKLHEPYIAEDSQIPSSLFDTIDSFTITVPENSYWVMGDNRIASADSLYHWQMGDNAFISEDSIIGKSWFAIDKWKSIRDVNYSAT